MTGLRRSRSDERDGSIKVIRIDNGQCPFDPRELSHSRTQKKTSGENHGCLHRTPNTPETWQRRSSRIAESVAPHSCGTRTLSGLDHLDGARGCPGEWSCAAASRG